MGNEGSVSHKTPYNFCSLLKRRNRIPDFDCVGVLQSRSSSLVRCLIAENPGVPSLPLLENMLNPKGPCGSLVSITQETQILFQSELMLVFKGEGSGLTNIPHRNSY